MGTPACGHRLPGVAIVAAVAALVLTAALVRPGHSTALLVRGGHAAAPPEPTVVTLDPASPGTSVPPGFLGLSVEYWALSSYAGENPAAVNPVLVRLLRALTPGQHPLLRIGGVSTDRTWWPVPGMKRPAGVNFELNKTRLQVARALASEVGGRLILGINFEADSPKIAAAEAQADISTIGRSRIAAFELGNEPELYSGRGYYRTPDGRTITGRSAGYDFQAFTHDFSRMSRVLPSVVLAGPATGANSWLRHLPELLSAVPRLRLVTVHRYPMQACYFPPGPRKYPTMAQLLSPASSSGLAASVAPDLKVAHSRHLALRIAEMNSIACGQSPGVSNSFGMALWALDALFSDIAVGVDGVNLHTWPGAACQFFTFKRSRSGWSAFVEPEYYGLLMFAEATPPGSRLVKADGATSTLRTWATLGPDGLIRVVALNTDTARPQTLELKLPGLHGSATVERLLAPGVHSNKGVSLGGRSFGPQTTTGQLSGRTHTERAHFTKDGYLVRVPAGSAALLTFR